MDKKRSKEPQDAEKGTLWFIGMLIRVLLIGLVLIALWAGLLKFLGLG